MSLPSYFPSLVLPKLASKHILDTLVTRRALASPTIFTSHYRKNSRFQTSAPVLLKHSLSFTLQLFSPDHPPHADFDVMCDGAPEPCLAVPSLSSGYTQRPLGIASPVHLSNYLPGRSCVSTCTERSTQTGRHISFRFEHRNLKPEPAHLRSQPQSFRFSHSGL